MTRYLLRAEDPAGRRSRFIEETSAESGTQALLVMLAEGVSVGPVPEDYRLVVEEVGEGEVADAVRGRDGWYV